ncbi:hypothetical protein ACFYSC_20610 [Streptosporangium sp. NPDC004379]
MLFHQNNTLADIRRIIGGLIAGARHWNPTSETRAPRTRGRGPFAFPPNL